GLPGWRLVGEGLISQERLFGSAGVESEVVGGESRSHVDPTLLNDFEMATDENRDPPVLDLRTMEEMCQPTLNGRECYDLIENMTAHQNDWDTSAQQSESSSSITSSSDPEIVALKAKMAEINKNLMKNVYAAGAYNQGGNSSQPQGNRNLLSYRSNNYLGPPGFNQNQNQNNQNQKYQNQNRNQGNNHLQGNNQGRANSSKELVMVKTHLQLIKPLTNMTSLTNSNLELKNMFGQFMKMNTASSSGSRTLPSNTITNPKEDLKGITTRSGNTYQGPTIPTTSSPPKVVERETESFSNNKDKLFELARTPLNEHCLAVLLKNLPEKLGDPGKILIPYDFPGMDECLSLADLGASINLMPLSVWNKLSLPELSPTCMTLKLTNRLISHPVGVVEDVFIKVGAFHFLANFVVVDFDADPRIPPILGRSFLKTGRALIDVYEGELTLRVGKEVVTFNLDQTSRYSANYDAMSVNRIDLIDVSCEDDFLLEEADAFLTIDDELISPEIDEFYYDSEGDILNDDLSSPPLPPQELKSMGEPHAPCSYKRTFAYRSMPFGLCNAPGMFQRYMMAIFHDMIEKTMEVFMDDFSVFGNSFGTCLSHLDKMLKRCEDTNLCLNWEKSHFMVKEGFVLGHKISKNGIEVDKAKVDVTTKLPHPTTVKGIHSFLGHAGFYR
nr:reverse transcriptase domain-containing protein [Tanacetum cinerariifolium]